MADRFIHLMKLGMGRHPQVDVTVPLPVLVEACKFYYDKGEAIAYIVGTNVKAGQGLDESNAIYVAELSDDDEFLSLLLVRGDPRRAIPAFVNPKTRKVTTIQSDEPGFVRGASSHIVISKQEIAKGSSQGRYRMAMEQATGIGRALARDLLGNLLARFADDHPGRFLAEKKRRKKGEKPEQIAYRPTVRFHPQENASLKQDLKDGRIGGFRLVRGKTDFQGEADDPKIERLNVQLHARIVPTDSLDKVRSLVDHMRQALDKIAFEDLKLELVDDAGATINIPGAISLDDADSEPDMRYCKKIAITGIKEVSTECHETFYKPIVGFSKKAISNEENWK